MPANTQQRLVAFTKNKGLGDVRGRRGHTPRGCVRASLTDQPHVFERPRALGLVAGRHNSGAPNSVSPPAWNDPLVRTRSSPRPRARRDGTVGSGVLSLFRAADGRTPQQVFSRGQSREAQVARKPSW